MSQIRADYFGILVLQFASDADATHRGRSRLRTFVVSRWFSLQFYGLERVTEAYELQLVAILLQVER